MADDRRDPTCPDRRAYPARRAEGRRKTDPIPPHGTRARYRRGCFCTPCRAANATYQAELRKDHAKGVLRLGMHISAKETWQRIRQLRPEFLTDTALALRLGYQAPADRRHVACLKLHRNVITVRNMLRVRLLHRQMALEGLNGPDA